MPAPACSACSARPARYVPGSGITLKVAAIRGVESNGMMCSVRELELGDAHDGIIELPADAPVGTLLPGRTPGSTDPVIDVSITPNRQDCMGVRGIARDLAAAGLGTLRPLADRLSPRPAWSIAGRARRPTCAPTIPEGCPAFFAQGVSGVTNGTSLPNGCAAALTAIGQKPISALVDITNFRDRSTSAARSTSTTSAKLTGPSGRAQGEATASRCSRSTARPIRSTRDDDGDRRRRPGPRHRRDHGRRGFGRVGHDHRNRADRMRLFRPRTTSPAPARSCC